MIAAISWSRLSDDSGKMARRAKELADPVASATALLRRLGFATLMLAIPTVALVSRRAVVVLAPIGISLLIIAAILDGENRPVGRSNLSFVGSTTVIATIVLLVWISLSLIWTPFFDRAAGRVGSILSMTALGVVGYYALPDRMRASNLYLLAVGVGFAAVAALAIAFVAAQELATPPDGFDTFQRGLVVIVIAVWPAVAWLSSRHRDLQALLLALAAGFASLWGPTLLPFIAFLGGAMICVLASIAPRVVVMVMSKGVAGLILLAPGFALVGAMLWNGDEGGWLHALSVWRDIIVSEPLRLVTGFGLESALRSRAAGLLSPDAPHSILFEIWYELGVVGAVAGALALHGAIIASAREHPQLTPGAMAAFASAFIMGAMGVSTTQMWWVTTLIVIGLIFIAIARGQFRTKRPKMLLPMMGER